MGGIIDTITGRSGKKAAQAANAGAATQAASQREALDYLKERERLPQQFREGALSNLAGIYGLEGGTGSQQQLVDQAMQSPLYTQMLQRGEDSVLRNASATGGLRSGNVQDNLARSSQDALLQTYNQQLSGIQGLANLPSNANAIAQGTAGIGQTLAQGQIAGANAIQQGNQALTNNLIGLGSAFAFSDIRAKKNIRFIKRENGFNIYEWEWNKVAKVLGLTGKSKGVMAHEIYEKVPKAIDFSDGFMKVNYKALNLDKYLEAA